MWTSPRVTSCVQHSRQLFRNSIDLSSKRSWRKLGHETGVRPKSTLNENSDLACLFGRCLQNEMGFQSYAGGQCVVAFEGTNLDLGLAIAKLPSMPKWLSVFFLSNESARNPKCPQTVRATLNLMEHTFNCIKTTAKWQRSKLTALLDRTSAATAGGDKVLTQTCYRTGILRGIYQDMSTVSLPFYFFYLTGRICIQFQV